MTRSVWVIALLLPMTGCALVGFDPLGAGGSSGSSGSGSGGGAGAAGNQPAGGSGGAPTGGAGGSSGTSSGSGGGSGSSDASVFMPDSGGEADATVPVTQCTGRDNLDPCDDGAFCTEDDFCWDEVCMPGDTRECGDGVCETNTCDETLDTCQTQNAMNGDPCLGLGMCLDGRCSSPVFTCPDGGECDPVCAGTCELGCSNVTSCEIDCLPGSNCVTNCQDSTRCDFDCDAAICFFNCQMTGTCPGVCRNGATCHVQCTDASGCEDIACLDGARCKLECLEESCGFSECWDEEGQTDCGDGTVACGVECADG